MIQGRKCEKETHRKEEHNRKLGSVGEKKSSQSQNGCLKIARLDQPLLVVHKPLEEDPPRKNKRCQDFRRDGASLLIKASSPRKRLVRGVGKSLLESCLSYLNELKVKGFRELYFFCTEDNLHPYPRKEEKRREGGKRRTLSQK